MSFGGVKKVRVERKSCLPKAEESNASKMWSPSEEASHNSAVANMTQAKKTSLHPGEGTQEGWVHVQLK